MTVFDNFLIHFKFICHWSVMVKTYYIKVSSLVKTERKSPQMKLLILCFSLSSSKPAILDDVDNLEFEEIRPNNDIPVVNGDMNFSYLKELLKLAWKYNTLLLQYRIVDLVQCEDRNWNYFQAKKALRWWLFYGLWWRWHDSYVQSFSTRLLLILIYIWRYYLLLHWTRVVLNRLDQRMFSIIQRWNRTDIFEEIVSWLIASLNDSKDNSRFPRYTSSSDLHA